MEDKRIFLVGASGRMGREICRVVGESSGWVINAKLGQEDGMYWSCSEVSSLLADIVIDFSTASLFPSVLKWCLENEKPLVSGTTGLSDSDFEQIENASKKIPILWSSNMSLGVAWLSSAIGYLNSIKDDFDFQIEELHHRHKIDAPSGTAIHLQSVLKKAVEKEVPDPVSIRGGGIFGVHKVWAMSEEEVITLEHQALNRAVFAKGAFQAAQWLSKQRAGRYQISDLISF